jgi:hypothetical protein
MNQDLRSALESMLDPEQNGWAFTERQRDCARVLLGLAPVELPKDVSVFDLLGLQGEWSYNLDKPKTVEVSWRDAKGDWVSSGVVAWMPLPDPAPLPEGD